ncbi:nucleotide sugar dehydrogenase [Virgibacillus flavescens]|uniref:nucleotide sugar dehydrogenase n=1 Tax=Virgibacillus flavescens TaxID=1611422 RepID=UPI003D34420B
MSRLNKKKDTYELNQVIGVVGLGYVGLPVAIAFSMEFNVIGYDSNEDRISSLTQYHDYTHEISEELLRESQITFTSNEQELSSCTFIIVAVPTPISANHEPDLSYLNNASTVIGKNLAPGTIVVYESTVFPGATEEVCIPILESESGLKAGSDFYVGYSPERINPSDKENTFQTINKLVAAQDEKTLDRIHALYQRVITAKVYKAASIKVAEASKIIENTQRDINIAFMNEISVIFDKLGINTHEAINAASTKWNFTPYYPGLVGGHCIGVDPYYLIHKSKSVGYTPKLLESAREINDYMPEYIVKTLLEKIKIQKKNIKGLSVTVLGITFKQNIPDTRNSKAIEIVEKLKKLSIDVQVCDPHVDHQHFKGELCDLHQLKKSDVLILAVPHKCFTSLPVSTFQSLLKKDNGIIIDIKGVLNKDELGEDIILWNL